MIGFHGCGVRPETSTFINVPVDLDQKMEEAQPEDQPRVLQAGSLGSAVLGSGQWRGPGPAVSRPEFPFCHDTSKVGPQGKDEWALR